MTRRQAILLFAAVFLVTLTSVFAVWKETRAPQSPPTRIQVNVAGVTVQATLAQTPKEHARGLSNVPSLRPDEGMLFLFSEPTMQQFWMKEMRFPIDIIWISAERRVIAMHESIAPSTYPELFSANAPVIAVLEVPAGWAAAHNATVGSPVSWDSQ